MTTRSAPETEPGENDSVTLGRDTAGMDWSNVTGFGANPITEADDADDARPFAEADGSADSQAPAPEGDAPESKIASEGDQESISGEKPQDEDLAAIKAERDRLRKESEQRTRDDRARQTQRQVREQRDETIAARTAARVLELLGKTAEGVGDTDTAKEAQGALAEVRQRLRAQQLEEQIDPALAFLADENKGLDDKPLFADINTAAELAEARTLAAQAHQKGDAVGVLHASLRAAGVYIAQLRKQAQAIPADVEKAKRDAYDEGYAAAIKRYRINDMAGGRPAASRGSSTDFETATPGEFFRAALDKRGGIPVNN